MLLWRTVGLPHSLQSTWVLEARCIMTAVLLAEAAHQHLQSTPAKAVAPCRRWQQLGRYPLRQREQPCQLHARGARVRAPQLTAQGLGQAPRGTHRQKGTAAWRLAQAPM